MLAKIFWLRSLTALEIVQYPHPTLRYKSKPITRVDRELREIVKSMFVLMYEAKGIGLAANQVDLPLQLFIVNTKSDPEEGEELVFINPVITAPKGSHEAEERLLEYRRRQRDGCPPRTDSYLCL